MNENIGRKKFRILFECCEDDFSKEEHDIIREKLGSLKDELDGLFN